MPIMGYTPEKDHRQGAPMTALETYRPGALDHPTDTRTWDDWAGRWLIDKASPHTRQAYGRDLAHFQRWLADTQHKEDPRTADRGDIGKYRAHVEAEGLKPATVARRLASLSSFYEYLLDEGQIRVNPANRVKRPKLSASSPRQWLTQDQARHCLTEATNLSPVHQALVGLCLLAGVRVSEALGLTIEDIGQAQGHTVATVTRKGGRADTVVLSDACLQLLAPVIKGRQSGPVIIGPRGGTIDRHRAARLIRQVGKAMGLTQPLVPHDLRHTCGVLSLKAGAPLDRVQQQLGHADPRTTQRYTRHLDQLDNAAAYDLDRYLVGDHS